MKFDEQVKRLLVGEAFDSIRKQISNLEDVIEKGLKPTFTAEKVADLIRKNMDAGFNTDIYSLMVLKTPKEEISNHFLNFNLQTYAYDIEIFQEPYCEDSTKEDYKAVKEFMTENLDTLMRGFALFSDCEEDYKESPQDWYFYIVN